MSLFRAAKRAAPSVFYEPPIPATYQGGGGGPGAPSVDRALQNDAVWACVRLLGDAISMLPLGAFTFDAQGVRRRLATQPQILTKPQDDATMPEWLWMLVASLMLRGNAYARVMARNFAGYPTQFELLNPDAVRPVRDRDTGKLGFRVGQQVLAREDVLHVKAYRLAGMDAGLSPVAYHALTINTDEVARLFGYGFFADGAHPSSVLTSDQPVNQEDADTIKARFRAAIKGREPAVLGAGFTYQAISVKPEESQFLETQKYGVAKIARIYGVPPEMVASESGNSMTYANVEQRNIEFLTYSVQPWLTRIEAALTAMVLPGANHVRFDTAQLLRTDHETLAKSSATRIASKQLTPDESRELYDLPPLTQEQRDLLDLVPLTVTPVGTPKALPGAAPVGEGAPDTQEAEPKGVTP